MVRRAKAKNDRGSGGPGSLVVAASLVLLGLTATSYVFAKRAAGAAADQKALDGLVARTLALEERQAVVDQAIRSFRVLASGTPK